MKEKKTNSIVLTARQLLSGYTTDADRRFLWNTAPYQLLPMEEKDDNWRKWNMDWLEYIGMRQVLAKSKNLNKLYDMANGVIDRTDYEKVDSNEFNSLVGAVVDGDSGPFSLKFYPIVPNIVNVLEGEFAKRDKKIIVKASDEFSTNEKLEYKEQMVMEALIADAKQKATQTLIQNGVKLDSKDATEKVNVAAQLAEAQIKYKTFRGIPEQWGQHKVNEFEDKYKMYELESLGFRDSVVSDSEFWHVDIREDDMNVEIWNPKNVFYHKSPDVYYISQGNYVGKIDLMSIPDVINLLGSRLTEDQIEHLKRAQSISIRGGNVVDDTKKHDPTAFWDASKTYEDQKPNSIHYEQYMGLKSQLEDSKNLDWNQIRNFNIGPYTQESLVRVTRAYWKTQKKVGHLTRIKEDGMLVQEIVDENYKVTIKPIYDNSIRKDKTVDNLLYGEHIDWIWINEVWKGVKVGPNSTTYYSSKGFGFDPIYIDIEPLKFQFKGQTSLYGCKLPVEGRIFTERNTTSMSPVGKMRSFQVTYNLVNNMVIDRLADNIGKVFLLDQNMIPRNSMDGEWGKNNYAKFYQIMKNYRIALVDTSMQNSESPSTGFSHFQQVDLANLDEIMALLKVAEIAKNEAFSVVGITPQRLGSIAASESATGVQQAVNNSYAQTEPIFDQHMNHLMPRVYQMMLEAAQYLCSEFPESTISYLNRDEEQEWFKINGYKLLLSDLNIYSLTKANIKETVAKLHQLLEQNNTAGGSLYEIAKGISMNSPSEIIAQLKMFDDKRNQDAQAEKQHELQMQQQQQEFLEKQKSEELTNDNYWKNRELELKQYLGELAAHKETTPPVEGEDPSIAINKQNLQDRQQIIDQNIANSELNLKNKDLDLRKYEKDIDYKIAKENKTKAELSRKGKK